MIVCDSGPLIAAASLDDRYHHESHAFFQEVTRSNQRMILPATVVAETGYMIDRLLGPRAESAFLQALADQVFEVVPLTPPDFARMARLVDQYADMPLGTTDASVIAIAERLNVTEIATLDRRHFAAVRPSHCTAFTLLP
ncbi:MAG: PIN domain-containing protein [Cellulomonadaceae bacterium]|jgi:predicted nucleic acid-binding protein|nr:PIN domain-containing protein [Cellulomonadaceae bacterium]